MNSNLPIEWEDKVNNPELLAFLQQYGNTEYLSAQEINQLRDAINELNQKIKELFLPKIQFTANGTDATFDLETIAKVKAVFWNGAILDDADWSQTTNILSLTFTPSLGEKIKPI
jgi:hypothetical protein